ncbi:unnamed protein product [Leptidea sinapis]|uniref:Uncharacterized protein n=1 Tax=Leptidea sinapis TaxID=189913 RepID=A0A5E4QY14_9NEOP|nr:unnamed protein product [Leptidea sinapis]
METQTQEVASPGEVPNDPGKMFVGGLSWQTSPGTLQMIVPRSASDALAARKRTPPVFVYKLYINFRTSVSYVFGDKFEV